MEIKKLQEELSLMLDVSRMSEEELEEKYAKDLETYQNFLMSFADLFVGPLPFPMLVYRKHDAIANMLKKKQWEFDDENISSLSQSISKAIEHEKKIGNEDYNEQGIWLFRDGIGAEKVEKEISVDSLLERMLKQTYVMEEALASPDLDLESVRNHMVYARMQTEMDYNWAHMTHAYRTCSYAYPKMKLWYQPDFLLTANYVMNGNHPGVKADKDFVDLVKDTIHWTKEYSMPFEVVAGYDMENYKRLAKLTERNISKYEQREKKKSKETNIEKEKENCQEEKKLRKVFAKRR